MRRHGKMGDSVVGWLAQGTANETRGLLSRSPLHSSLQWHGRTTLGQALRNGTTAQEAFVLIHKTSLLSRFGACKQGFTLPVIYRTTRKMLKMSVNLRKKSTGKRHKMEFHELKGNPIHFEL